MKKEFPKKRLLIIFTGGPGTGKSETARRFIDYLDQDEIVTVSYDQIKEKNWDRFGFDNCREKERLNFFSLEEFYLTVKKRMWESKTILIEYPFYQRHKPELEALVKESGYLAATVFLYTDLRTVYQRGADRDQLDNRHPGHFLSAYHRETYQPKQLCAALKKVPSYEEFVHSIAGKAYNVELGVVIPVDVTDFSKVSYERVYNEIIQYQKTN